MPSGDKYLIDWSGWKAEEHWPLGVACALVNRLEPYVPETQRKWRYIRAYAAARDAIRRGKLKGTEYTDEEAKHVNPWVGDHFEVDQRGFLRWAKAEGYDVPPELDQPPLRNRSRRDLEYKVTVQNVARGVFAKHPDWRTGQVSAQIIEDGDHLRRQGQPIAKSTVQKWVSEIASEDAKKAGAPKKRRNSTLSARAVRS